MSTAESLLLITAELATAEVSADGTLLASYKRQSESYLSKSSPFVFSLVLASLVSSSLEAEAIAC